jgi:calcium-dependent protein kinase
MLTRDPLLRPTAAELLRHPWLSAATRSLDEWDDRLQASRASSSLNIHSSSSASISASVKAAGGNGSSSNGGSSSSNSGSSSAGRSRLRTQSLAGMRPLADTLVQRLQRYGTWGRLKQVAHSSVVSAWSKPVYKHLP